MENNWNKKTIDQLQREGKIHLIILAIDSSKMTEKGAVARIHNALEDMLNKKIISMIWTVEKPK